jgi:hypothetical protein
MSPLAWNELVAIRFNVALEAAVDLVRSEDTHAAIPIFDIPDEVLSRLADRARVPEAERKYFYNHIRHDVAILRDSVRRTKCALAAKSAVALRDVAETLLPALGSLDGDARIWIEEMFECDLSHELLIADGENPDAKNARAVRIDDVIKVASCIVRATSGTRQMQIRKFGYGGVAGRDGRPRAVETLAEAVQGLCLRLLRDVGEAGGRLAGKRLFNAVELLCRLAPDTIPHVPSERTLKRLKADFEKWAKTTPMSSHAALVRLLEMRALPVLNAADVQDVERRALHVEKVGQHLRGTMEAAADYFLAILGPIRGRSAHGLLLDAARDISDECTEAAATLRITPGRARKAKAQPRRAKNP